MGEAQRHICSGWWLLQCLARLDDQSSLLPPSRLLEGPHDQIRIGFDRRDDRSAPVRIENAVYTIFDEIEAALVRRNRVELRGFGAFFVKPRPARLRRNPKTGVAVSLPQTLHPVFRTGKEMKARLNGTAGSALRAAFHKSPDNKAK